MRHVRHWIIVAGLLFGCEREASTVAAGCAADGAACSAHADEDPAARAVTAPAVDHTGVAGEWYLAMGEQRATVRLRRDADGALDGSFQPDNADVTALADVVWNDTARTLRFRVRRDGYVYWFDGRVVEGVFTARVATTLASDTATPAATAYSRHATAWNATVIDAELVPRVWDLRADDGYHARLRIDRDARGLVGTFKVYARDGLGATVEELEYDLKDVVWDGESLAFSVTRADTAWRFEGSADGRTLALAATAQGGGTRTWTGARAEVLSHGLVERPVATMTAWRTRVRARLALLTMAGDPAPTATRVTVLSERALATADASDPAQHGYALSELRLDHTLPDPRGGADLTRSAHVYVAKPDGAAPAGGYPTVIALNGHGGSAAQTMNPASRYWYGDAYARRGYLVVAVDVSHRPFDERSDLYGDYNEGDDPPAGNGTHPAIASPGFDTDWEEEGERTWDAMRAVDLALTRLDARPSSVLAVGLSMGGEEATNLGAFDPRVTGVIAAGYAPDFAVMRNHGNHPCWRWRYGDIEEFIDVSDLHALVAPRPLVVETGLVDPTFSYLSAPYASDKQVLRRSRVAWPAEGRRVIHDLHPGAHVFHVGDPALDGGDLRGLQYALAVRPTAANPVLWQTDSTTRALRFTAFDLLLSPRN